MNDVLDIPKRILTFVILSKLINNYLNDCLMKKYLFMIATLLLLVSCEENQLKGKWDDCIKLSSKTAQFTSTGGTEIITAENIGWWICLPIEVDNEKIFTNDKHPNNNDLKFTLTHDWITIERRDKALVFTALPNTTGKERTAYLTLEAGDYFDHIHITQTAE